MLVSLDGIVNSKHIWLSEWMELLEVFLDGLWVLPVRMFLEQAKVDDGQSCNSCDRGSVMEINFETSDVDEVIESDGTLSKILAHFLLVFIVDRVIDDLVDSLRFVHPFDQVPVDVPGTNFLGSLDVHDSFCFERDDFVDINLIDWVWSKDKILFCDVIYEEPMQKVAVSLVDDSVDKVRLLFEALVIMPSKSELTSVRVRLL